MVSENASPRHLTPTAPGESSPRRGPVGELLAGSDPVNAECARMLETIRNRCPGLLPADALKPGTVGPEIFLKPDEFQRLASVAAPAAAGLPAGLQAETVVWSQAGNELLVILAKVRVRTDEGIVVVVVPVHCDQVPEAEVIVAFAVGEDRRPAGLIAAAEDRPRGPTVVVDLWGEALTAFAWQVLLTTAAGVAGGAGTDTDGAPLIPAGLKASRDGLRILTMSRHPFDRAVP
jgi:hypothetical protein